MRMTRSNFLYTHAVASPVLVVVARGDDAQILRPVHPGDGDEVVWVAHPVSGRDVILAVGRNAKHKLCYYALVQFGQTAAAKCGDEWDREARADIINVPVCELWRRSHSPLGGRRLVAFQVHHKQLHFRVARVGLQYLVQREKSTTGVRYFHAAGIKYNADCSCLLIIFTGSRKE